MKELGKEIGIFCLGVSFICFYYLMMVVGLVMDELRRLFTWRGNRDRE